VLSLQFSLPQHRLLPLAHLRVRHAWKKGREQAKPPANPGHAPPQASPLADYTGRGGPFSNNSGPHHEARDLPASEYQKDIRWPGDVV
jgi:hypothetical protein